MKNLIILSSQKTNRIYGDPMWYALTPYGIELFTTTVISAIVLLSWIHAHANCNRHRETQTFKKN